MGCIILRISNKESVKAKNPLDFRKVPTIKYLRAQSEARKGSGLGFFNALRHLRSNLNVIIEASEDLEY